MWHFSSSGSISIADTAAAEIEVVVFSGKSSDSGRALIFGVERLSSFVKSISDVDEGVCFLDGIISESWTISLSNRCFVDLWSDEILNSSMDGLVSR